MAYGEASHLLNSWPDQPPSYFLLEPDLPASLCRSSGPDLNLGDENSRASLTVPSYPRTAKGAQTASIPNFLHNHGQVTSSL